MFRKSVLPLFVVFFILVSSTAPILMAPADKTAAPFAFFGATSTKAQAPQTQQDGPAAPLDAPDTLVPASQEVWQMYMAAPKIFWYSGSVCIPTLQSDSDQPLTPAATDREIVARIATYGGQIREIYHKAVNEICGQQQLDFRSNIVADEDFIYWSSASLNGIARLSTSANVGDPPELFSSAASGYLKLAEDEANVYALTGSTIWRMPKSGEAPDILTSLAGTSPLNLQSDGKYVYWMTSGALRRLSLNSKNISTISPSGVTGYYPEGRRLVFCTINPVQCTFTENVFIGKGRDVVRYDNLTGNTSAALYHSPDSTARVYAMTSDFSRLFVFESRSINCAPLCSSQSWLTRMTRSGTSQAVIYVSPASIGEPPSQGLETYDGHLFWSEGGILRLANDAASLPLTNMRITGVEVTQAIQDLNNSVRLIRDRRTFVRVHVKSDDPTKNVPGVGALLYRVDGTGTLVGSPILPANAAGTHITVQADPDRDVLDESFLFELPWSWVSGGTLRLRAELNPAHYPPQASYANNTWTTQTFNLSPSPSLEVQFVGFGYILNNQFYYPRFVKDIVQTYSWIRRVYPLASTVAFMGDSAPGFRPNLWLVPDDGLGSRVDQSAPECLKMEQKFRSLCASAYTNNLLKAMRTDNNISSQIFMYGMISDQAGFFPRGSASGGKVSTGPAGVFCCGSNTWDFDGSYADQYAGHEIGHTLGRDHPFTGSSLDTNVCGNTPEDGALDNNYPHPDSQIGDNDGALQGFNVGDAGLGIDPAVYPGDLWTDVMGYCPRNWISEYTYEGMYQYMTANPPPGLAVEGPDATNAGWIAAFGVILPDSSSATFHEVTRSDSVAEIPDLVPGPYSLRLLNGSGTTLADYPFTPEPVSEETTSVLSFGQVVADAAGAARLQVVRLSDSAVLAEQPLSANPPSVSSVTAALTGEDGLTVQVSWSASDPDNDKLSYDVFYTTGGELRPVAKNHPTMSIQIDSADLPGGSGVFRVVASDGANTGQADSAPLAIPAKAPQVRITTPADGHQVHWGQLINFAGEVYDLQDGSLPPASLVWSTPQGVLGTGPLLSIVNLPVGTHQVTLTATNSDGKSASDTITVIVDDDLNLPGPTLVAGPSQIGWSVAPGSVTPVSAQVHLANAGSGVLDWTAEVDAAWLSLDLALGSAPADLTLTADPSGLEEGASLSATLTLGVPDTGQKIEIPVSLSVGDVWHSSEGTYFRHLFLPLVEK